MAVNALSFSPPSTHQHNGNVAACPIFKMLPSGLQEASHANPHLWEYLHVAPLEKTGIPEFYPELNRTLGGIANRNLIYPISDEVFVHILSDPTDSRDYYIPVEPGVGCDFASIMEVIELRLVDLLDELDQSDAGTEQRRELLLRSLEKVTTTRGVKTNSHSQNGPSSGVVARGNKVVLTEEQLEAIRYLLLRDKEGLGPLQVLIGDPHIEDISCSGLGPIFVEHKIFSSLKSTVSFSSFEELDDFVIRLSEKIGKPVSYRDPIVDAALPDGSRINIVFGGDLSKRGSNFTVRKFTTTPLSVIELIEFNTLSHLMAAYLSLVIGEGMNVFVSGETASGKTTTLNALTTFIPPNAKIVSIEDTPELQVPHPNWIREVARGNTKATSASTIAMYDLLKAALRQRPNEIIVGEIRGEEGAVAFQGMQTGHAGMATFHAASVEKLIQRLTGNPINIPKSYIDNLNVVVIQSAVRLPSGKTGRRVTSINEIIGYDPASDSFSFIEIFRWDPVNDRFEFRGAKNSYLLENKIALRRGIPPTQKRTIYNELERRARILQRLQEQGVKDFYALYHVLAKAHREGVFR